MSLSWLFQVKCSVSTPAEGWPGYWLCAQPHLFPSYNCNHKLPRTPHSLRPISYFQELTNWEQKIFWVKKSFQRAEGGIFAGHARKSAVVVFLPFLAESCNISQRPCPSACWGRGSSSGDSRGSCRGGCGSSGPSWWRAAASPPPSPGSSRSLKYRSWLTRPDWLELTHESSRPRWLLPARNQKIGWEMFRPRLSWETPQLPAWRRNQVELWIKCVDYKISDESGQSSHPSIHIPLRSSLVSFITA